LIQRDKQMSPKPLSEVEASSFAKHERFAYWAEVVTKKFVLLECDSPDRAGFQGIIRHRQIGLIGVSEVRASAMSARRTPATIALAPSDDLIVVLHTEGICHVGQSAETIKLVPGAHRLCPSSCVRVGTS
jgi:hypothetical protein